MSRLIWSVPCSMRCTGAAKADPARTFYVLYDKVLRRDVLRGAWAAVRRNNGAPGIDKITLAGVEEYGIDRLLGELASELEGEGRLPATPPARWVDYIPKPGAPAGRAEAAFHSFGP